MYFIHINYRKLLPPFQFQCLRHNGVPSCHIKVRKHSILITTMLSVPASTQSHKKTSPAYKSMTGATTTSTPSTVVELIHAAPRMSSTSQHNAAIGSGIVVERERERERGVSVRAESSSSTTLIRSVRSNRIQSTGMHDGSVRSSRTLASTTVRSSQLS